MPYKASSICHFLPQLRNKLIGTNLTSDTRIDERLEKFDLYTVYSAIKSDSKRREMKRTKFRSIRCGKENFKFLWKCKTCKSWNIQGIPTWTECLFLATIFAPENDVCCSRNSKFTDERYFSNLFVFIGFSVAAETIPYVKRLKSVYIPNNPGQIIQRNVWFAEYILRLIMCKPIKFQWNFYAHVILSDVNIELI